MLAMLAALLKPTEGTIIVDQHNLAEMNEAKQVEFRRRKLDLLSKQITSCHI